VNLTYTDKKTGAVTASSHGDLFSIHGATCKPDRPHPLGWLRCLPSENRCKGGGEWNHYRVVATDGTIKLHVNGKEVSGVSECKPRKGYLALESEGAECHFRNLTIKELPSSHPKPDEIAAEAKDFRPLFTGLDLSGWEAGADTPKHWQPRDWMLHTDGQGGPLATAKEFGDAEFIIDFRYPKGGGGTGPGEIVLRDGRGADVKVSIADGRCAVTAPKGTESRALPGLKPAGEWNRLQASLQGDSLRLSLNGQPAVETGIAGARAAGALVLRPVGAVDFGNLFVRELKK
jgi:hypothetical protein